MRYIELRYLFSLSVVAGSSALTLLTSPMSGNIIANLPVFQLGLPLSAVVTVPLYLNTHKMDVLALEKQVGADREAGKTPLMVVAYAGTPVVGHVDDLRRIQAICHSNDIWLHIEGYVGLLRHVVIVTATVGLCKS